MSEQVKFQGSVEQLKVLLAKKIYQCMQNNKLTQAEAAVFLETRQPRVSLIVNLKLDSISLEALYTYAQRMGCEVVIYVD